MEQKEKITIRIIYRVLIAVVFANPIYQIFLYIAKYDIASIFVKQESFHYFPRSDREYRNI